MNELNLDKQYPMWGIVDGSGLDRFEARVWDYVGDKLSFTTRDAWGSESPTEFIAHPNGTWWDGKSPELLTISGWVNLAEPSLPKAIAFYNPHTKTGWLFVEPFGVHIDQPRGTCRQLDMWLATTEVPQPR